MKRSLMLLTAIILAVSATFTTYRPAPTYAATPTLADFFPEKTFVYAEMDTSNLSGTIDSLVTFANQFDAKIPTDWRTLATDQLGKALKTDTKFDFDKDLIGWIGDRIAYGVYVPEAMFQIVTRNQPTTPGAQPQAAVIVTVKDEAKADAFFNDIFLKAMPSTITPTTETINGETVTIYSNIQPNTMIARWKGYIVAGEGRFILDTIKDKKPALSGDANYKKLMATLKPGTLGSVYTRTPFSLSSASLTVFTLALLGPAIGNVFSNIVMGLQGTPTPTPSPTPSPSPDEQRLIELFVSLGGSIYSVRSEGKALILDVTSAYDNDVLKRIGDLLKVDLSSVAAVPTPVAGKLVDAIPANAPAVIIGSDIPQIYNSTVAMTVAMLKGFSILERKPGDPDPMKTVTTQIEGTVKMVTGLDLKTDILGWTGDYAIYLTEDKGGTLDAMTEGALPYAQNVVIASSDPAKSAAFAAAMARLVNSQTSKDALGTPDASGMFTIALSPKASAKVGTMDGNLVISTDAKFTAKPASAISASAVWQNAIKFAPKGYSQLFYLDTGKADMLFEAFAKLSRGNSSSQNQIAQLRTAIKPFESALIVYTPQGTGMGTATFVLIQK